MRIRMRIRMRIISAGRGGRIMSYAYLAMVKNKDNMNEVATILSCLADDTVMTQAAIEYRLRQLEKLKEIGEEEIYEKLLEKLRDNPGYSSYLARTR